MFFQEDFKSVLFHHVMYICIKIFEVFILIFLLLKVYGVWGLALGDLSHKRTGAGFLNSALTIFTKNFGLYRLVFSPIRGCDFDN